MTKTETHYHETIDIKGSWEDFEIVQEESEDRKAIKIKVFEDRWRTVPDTIELLEKIISILKKDF